MNMKRLFYFGLCMLSLILGSCTDIDISMPKGPQGSSGLSAYELWKQRVNDGTINWPADQTQESDFFKYLKGQGGTGLSAYEEWKNYIASGNVPNPHQPGSKWDPNANSLSDFYTFLTGATGESGQTPHIGQDGNWWIGNVNSNISARGPKGDDGATPQISIGNDGFWYINGTSTNIRAYGNEGAPGKSAYDLWKEHIAGGKVPDPHNPGSMWPAGRNSLTDFWEFLRGPKGSDGQDGKDGMPGEPIILGKPNVLPIYYNGPLREYVNPEDGSVIFMVFDSSGSVVGADVEVSKIPGLNPTLTFKTNAEGKFKITRDMLPNNRPLTARKGNSLVKIGSISEPSAENTFVPNRINTRIVDEFVYPRDMTGSITYSYSDAFHFVVIKYRYEREVDGEWKEIPSIYPKPTFSPVKVIDPTQAVTESNIRKGPEYDRWRISVEKFTMDFAAHKDKNILLIKRPQVLTADEEAPSEAVTAQETCLNGAYRARLRDARIYKWDGEKQYYSIRGESFLYGETPLMPAAVHIPEIHPHPTITDFKAEIKSGQTNLWGTVLKSNYPKFYPKYTPPTASATPRVWEAVETDGSKLFEAPYLNTFYLRFYSTKSGGDQTAQLKMINGDNKLKFSFSSAYPEYMITIYCRITGDIGGKISHGAENPDILGTSSFLPYRGIPNYLLMLQIESAPNPSRFFLQNPFFKKGDPAHQQELTVEEASGEYRLMN